MDAILGTGDGLSVADGPHLFAPAGTPAPIVNKLREAVAAVLKDPAIPTKLRPQGLEPLDLDGPAFREFAVRDLKRWTEISRTIDFKLDQDAMR